MTTKFIASKDMPNGMIMHMMEQSTPHRFWITIESEGEHKACRAFIKRKKAAHLFNSTDKMSPYQLIRKVLGVK